MPVETVHILQDLGLNNLEAQVYHYLLANAPQTAYHVAKELGKPTANVYKAVEALCRKGAVLVEEGDNRLCRAVPAKELIGHLKDDFALKIARAEKSLANVNVDVRDEAVYQLESSSLVLERCRTMLDRCRKIAVVDAFPGPLEFIGPAIKRAIRRKVNVYLQVYRPLTIPGAVIAITPGGEEALKYWSSQQLNIVIDGEEHLLALMNQNLTMVYQATWSQSLYLSCILHAGLMQEHIVHRMRSASNKSNALKHIRRILSEVRFFLNTDVPGQKALFSKYVSPATVAEE
jgi:sugar-specific transcriptional regulator TrmB